MKPDDDCKHDGRVLCGENAGTGVVKRLCMECGEWLEDGYRERPWHSWPRF